jgi:transcriptional regulator with XRE-family HTH domain
MKDLGARIRQARDERGWSQNELASRAAIKQPTLQRIEAGLRLDPSIRTIAAIASALDLSVDTLLAHRAGTATSKGSVSRVTLDAIEELTRHVADMERRFEARIAALEGSSDRRRLRSAK